MRAVQKQTAIPLHGHGGHPREAHMQHAPSLRAGKLYRLTHLSRLSYTVAGALAALNAGSAAAQTAAPAALPEITVSAPDTASKLNTPGTAAGRLNLTPLETPASVAVILGDTIPNAATKPCSTPKRAPLA